MSCREKKHPWSVFDAFKPKSNAPEPLMADINSAIAALEYARAAILSQSPDTASNTKNTIDAQVANEAYKAGLASMSAGRADEAVISLNVALSKCPPEKTSAVAKIHSLISHVSQQPQKSSKRRTP